MLIFLYGPDTYRSRQKLNEIIERYKKIHKSGLNLKVFDLKEKNFQDFKDEVKSVSMFDEKKLVILKNVISNKSFQEDFLKNAKYFTKSSDIFVFYEEEIPENNQFFKFLKKKGRFQEFKLLEGERLKNWVKKEFEKYRAPYQNKFGTRQAKIEPEALELLISYVGNNLWQLSNEIKKLVSYKKNQKIVKKDVEILVKPKIETDIFKTIDAIASKNKKRALELLHKHLEKGDSPLYLLSMINFQFRNLLIIRDLIEKKKSPYNFSKITNLHPFIIRKSYSQAQKFGLSELKKIYQKIFEVDIDIKTGKVDPQTALDLLITEI